MCPWTGELLKLSPRLGPSLGPSLGLLLTTLLLVVFVFSHDAQAMNVAPSLSSAHGPSSAFTFTQRKPLPSATASVRHRSTTSLTKNPRSRSLCMYFDDLSRNKKYHRINIPPIIGTIGTIGTSTSAHGSSPDSNWFTTGSLPSALASASASKSIQPPAGSPQIYFSDGRQGFKADQNQNGRTEATAYSYSTQKLEALQKSLYGYNPDTVINQLSLQDIQSDVLFWMENVDLQQSFFPSSSSSRDGNDIHTMGDDENVIVCQETNLVSCMAFLWEKIKLWRYKYQNPKQEHQQQQQQQPKGFSRDDTLSKNDYDEYRDFDDNDNDDDDNDNIEDETNIDCSSSTFKNIPKYMTIVFPYCKEMYNYEHMKKWYNILLQCLELSPSTDSSSSNTANTATIMDISLFHPTYENQPKMLSLLRHAPFPLYIIHPRRENHEWLLQKEQLWLLDGGDGGLFGAGQDRKNDDGRSYGDKNTAMATLDDIFGQLYGNHGNDDQDEPRSANSDNISDAMVSDYLNQRRQDFEKLFNSKAATSYYGNDGSSDDISDGKEEDEDDMYSSLGVQQKVQQKLAGCMESASTSGDIQSNLYPSLEDEPEVQETKEWIMQNLIKTNDKNNQNENDKAQGAYKSNKALKFMIGPNNIIQEWIISDATNVDELYNEIWKIVEEIYSRGIITSFHDEKNQGAEVLSAILIVPEYSMYNANEFKRFAISVNAMLKLMSRNSTSELPSKLRSGNTGNTGSLIQGNTSQPKLFIELFHPEYVGKKSSKSSSRRSPYPTLQICVESTRTNS